MNPREYNTKVKLMNTITRWAALATPVAVLVISFAGGRTFGR